MFAVLALAVGALAWWMRRAPRSILGLVLGVSLAATALGAVTGLDAYPWSNAVVLAVAMAGGALLAGILPARALAMFLVLAALAALDLAQLLISLSPVGSDIAPWFSLLVRGDDEVVLQIGVVDVLVVAAMAIHGSRRGIGFLPSVLSAPIGLLIALVVAAVTHPPEGLVLLPFLLIGWLVVEAWLRIRS